LWERGGGPGWLLCEGVAPSVGERGTREKDKCHGGGGGGVGGGGTARKYM